MHFSVETSSICIEHVGQLLMLLLTPLQLPEQRSLPGNTFEACALFLAHIPYRDTGTARHTYKNLYKGSASAVENTCDLERIFLDNLE
jgi:hypothetical protein